MIQTPHLFSHQQQHYGQSEQSSWASHSQQQSHQGLSHAQQHAQAQAQAQAAAAAAAAQQQAYNRIAVNQNHHNTHSQNNNRDNRQSSGDNMNNAGNSMTEQGSPGMGMGDISEENRKVLQWVAELMDPARREGALMELSKKREQVPELALVLWHSFGVMTSLLQEIISVYPLLNPSQLTATASNRVCNALALLQCVASHNETRGLFLSGMSAMSVQRPLPC
jgi:CCR4-NOT transcription complex subunit 9